MFRLYVGDDTTDTSNRRDFYPKSFSVTIEDVDLDSGRDNSTGNMVRNRIGIKRTLAITMPPMKGADADNLLVLVGREKFLVNYYDPYEGGRVTKTFYPGNRTCTMYYEGGSGHGLPYDVLWESIAFDLVEM